MKIAFFDSGIGGLTVLHEAIKMMPHEDYIYYADSANIPYGTKTAEAICDLVFNAVECLSAYDLKALVLACNTATSVVIKALRNKYDFPIIGMEPALKPALEIVSEKKILLCATDRTLQEDKLNRLIEQTGSSNKVIKHSLQGLVKFAEDFDFDSEALWQYLKIELKGVNATQYSSIVLGCTHFLFYQSHLSSIVGADVALIDGNMGTIRHLKNNISVNGKSGGSVEYLSSNPKLKRPYFEAYLAYYERLQKAKNI